MLLEEYLEKRVVALEWLTLGERDTEKPEVVWKKEKPIIVAN